MNNLSIHGIIAAGEEERGVGRMDTIKASGMSTSSFYTAWRNPELFRLRDLNKIYSFLRIPEEDRRYS